MDVHGIDLYYKHFDEVKQERFPSLTLYLYERPIQPKSNKPNAYTQIDDDAF